MLLDQPQYLIADCLSLPMNPLWEYTVFWVPISHWYIILQTQENVTSQQMAHGHSTGCAITANTANTITEPWPWCWGIIYFDNRSLGMVLSLMSSNIFLKICQASESFLWVWQSLPHKNLGLEAQENRYSTTADYGCRGSIQTNDSGCRHL